MIDTAERPLSFKERLAALRAGDDADSIPDPPAADTAPAEPDPEPCDADVHGCRCSKGPHADAPAVTIPVGPVVVGEPDPAPIHGTGEDAQGYIVPLARADVPLIATVEDDDITTAIVKPFDLAPDDHIGFYPWVVPADLPTSFSIGVIVGASGSGKSQLLARFGAEETIDWAPSRSIASHFADADDASERFYAVGLNSVPVWRLPYHVMSNGQKFRADLARRLKSNAVIDEFTSVVDRNVAIAASRSMRAYVDRTKLGGIVIATCHRDVVPWLRPDWTIDTDAGELIVGDRPNRPQWWMEHVKPEGKVGAIGLG